MLPFPAGRLHVYALAFAIALSLAASPAIAVEADRDEDGLGDFSEVSRVRSHPFSMHLVVDEYPGDRVESDPLLRFGYGLLGFELADLDGDGREDLVFDWVIGLEGIETLWRRNRLSEPEGDFAPAVSIEFDALSGKQTLGLDLDRDGDTDLVSIRGMRASPLSASLAATWSSNRLDEQTGDFAPAQSVHVWEAPPIHHPLSIAFADLDGDEGADLVWFDDGLWWRENRLDEPSGDFGAPALLQSDAPEDVFDPTLGLQFVDLDVDGDIDVLLTSYDACRIDWYENRLNEPSADFSPRHPIVSGETGSILAGVADFDGDDAPDLVTFVPVASARPICSTSRPPATFWIRNGLRDLEPKLEAPELLFEKPISLLATADFDGDADEDFLAGEFDGFGFRPTLQENRLGEDEETFTALDFVLDRLPNLAQTRAADLDEDGDADLVTLAYKSNPSIEYGSYDLVWLENPGTDPDDPDSDGDGFLDGAEDEVGSDPNDASSTPLPEPGGARLAGVALLVLASLRARVRSSSGPVPGESA